MSEGSSYRVELELFAGPLDLLLYLVRRHELELVDLPLAQITQQFQEFLEVLEILDLELVGDFMVTASTLMEMKSREALPSSQEEQDAEQPLAAGQDPSSDLIEKLLEYKRFKEAARAIEEQAAEWQERYPRLAQTRPSGGKDPAADRIKEVELWDLVSAFGRIVRRQEVAQESRIRYDETPISVYVEQIGSLVREKGEVRFTSLFDDQTQRSKIIGMFLAVLELLRHHGFRAEQPVPYGEILLRPPLADSSPAASSGG
jgi:segregation and condensation protein A